MKNYLLLLLSSLFLFFTFSGNLYSQCNGPTEEPSLFCNPNVVICNLEGLSSTLPQGGGSGPIPGCGGTSLENPHFFSFIATNTTLSLVINATNCTIQNCGSGPCAGVQLAIYQGCPVIQGRLFPGSCLTNCGPPQPVQTLTFNSSNFILGQQYVLLLDGCAGSICDYEVVLVEGLQYPDLSEQIPTSTDITGDSILCPGETATFTATQPVFASSFDWVIVETNQTFNTSDRNFFYTIPTDIPQGTYTVCLTNACNQCSNLQDFGYAGNACFTFNVALLPPVDIGEIIVCHEDLPYTRDGFSFTTSGDKEYTINSALGCDSVINLSLIVTTPILIQDSLIFNDHGSGNGAISVTPSGGFPPYTFTWSNGATSPLIQNLSYGEYTVTITDSLQCSSVFTFTVENVSSANEVEIPGFKASLWPIPNKAGERIFIEIDNDIPGLVEFILLNVSGIRVRRMQTFLTQGTNQLSMDTPMAPGIYWMEVVLDNGRRAIIKLLLY